jgi:hypothetical protein
LIYVECKEYIDYDDSIKTNKEIVVEWTLNNLPRCLENVVIKKVVDVAFFPHTMPQLTKEVFESLQSNQGKNDVYFCGQYMGFPSLETATYFGAKVGYTVLDELSPGKSSLLKFEHKYKLINDRRRNELLLWLA